MAHALSITDGTTTFSLSTTNAYLILYVPTEAQPVEAPDEPSAPELLAAGRVAYAIDAGGAVTGFSFDTIGVYKPK